MIREDSVYNEGAHDVFRVGGDVDERHSLIRGRVEQGVADSRSMIWVNKVAVAAQAANGSRESRWRGLGTCSPKE